MNQVESYINSIKFNIETNKNQNNYENAVIARNNVELASDQLRNDVFRQYVLAWKIYDSAKEQVTPLENSLKNAQDYLALMTLRFQEGQSTVIELREAERSYEEANLRKINNEVTLKLAETDILRISGGLIR